jgi:predicted nucleic acid-binding protein
MPVADVREALDVIRSVCSVVPLTQETHDLGLSICERYRLSVYDSMIVAAAVLADCGALMSEDLQHGQKFAGRLRVVNPFR